ncbi:unnamed protein product [Brassica rapa subsp. narinosa]
MWFWKAWWGDVNGESCLKTFLFDGLDGLEEGRLKASSSYSHGTSERAMMNHWRVCMTEFNF